MMTFKRTIRRVTAAGCVAMASAAGALAEEKLEPADPYKLEKFDSEKYERSYRNSGSGTIKFNTRSRPAFDIEEQTLHFRTGSADRSIVDKYGAKKPARYRSNHRRDYYQKLIPNIVR